MNKRLHVNVPSMVFQDELGEDFDLPASIELEKAILVINKACFDEVQRRKKHLLEEFIGRKFMELHTAIREGACTSHKKALIMDIINYDRKNKLEL